MKPCRMCGSEKPPGRGRVYCSDACSVAGLRAWEKRGRDKASATIAELKRRRGCAHCGFDNPDALDFHHRDPSLKSFNVMRMCTGSVSVRILAEIAKCDVLCANCHRIYHAEEWRTGG